MENGNRRRVAFLDRDGTLAEEMGYLNHLSRFHLYPFAAEAVRRLNQAGLAVVVVTNQSGATRGFFPEDLIRQVHERMVAELAAAGACIDAVYYCPHTRDADCGCRKPRPGMLERASRELGFTLEGSFMVSDRYADVQMGQAIGGRGILVLTGYGRGEYEWNRESWPRQPDWVAENLLAATDAILRQS